MEILPRSAWTDTAPGWNRRPLYVVPVGIACHWPASGRRVSSRSDVAAALRAHRRHHVVNRDWPDIGYNYAVDQAGRVWELAGRRQAAHAASDANPDANAELYGVLFVVATGEEVSDAAIAAFRELRAHLGAHLPVMGHGDVRGAQTACPGPSVRAAIAAGKLTSGSRPTTPARPAPPAPNRPEELWHRMDKIDLKNAHQRVVTGRHVDVWQALLLAAGYGPDGLVDKRTGRPDGRGGPATKRLTGEFQVKHNTGDGKGRADYVVGPASWRKGMQA